MKTWDLKRGDIVINGEQELEFIKMDGAYAHWTVLEGENKGEMAIGNFGELEERDGKFYPVN